MRALALCVLVLLTSGTGLVQGAASPFRDGDVITIVVGFSPGGGFDRIARIIQPYFQSALEDILGKRITVIVENLPGAGARMAHESVYHSPPDGKRLLLLGSQGACVQQVGMPVGFDIEKFTFLCQVNRSDWGLLVRNDLPVKDMNDWIKRSQVRPVLIGTSGAGSSDHVASLIMKAILAEAGVDYRMDFVHFSSFPTVAASMMRKEAEAYLGSVESTLPSVKDGTGKIIVVFAGERSAYFPNVPTATEQGIAMADQISLAIKTGRYIVGPPGIPEDKAAVLEKALEAALANPALREKASLAELPVMYASGADARRSVLAEYGYYSRYARIVKDAMGIK